VAGVVTLSRMLAADAAAKLAALKRLRESLDAITQSSQSSNGVENFVAVVVSPLLGILEAMPPQFEDTPVQSVRHAALELLSKLHASAVRLCPAAVPSKNTTHLSGVECTMWPLRASLLPAADVPQDVGSIQL